jgi:hypothetical protein
VLWPSIVARERASSSVLSKVSIPTIPGRPTAQLSLDPMRGFCRDEHAALGIRPDLRVGEPAAWKRQDGEQRRSGVGGPDSVRRSGSSSTGLATYPNARFRVRRRCHVARR